MAEFPALPLWTDAYLGDTTHLTTIEHGAYLLLLMTAWRTADCALPDDDRLLARYARMNGQQWKRVRPIIQAFFGVENGKWKQGRLTDERDAVKQHRLVQSNKGKAGAAAKALKNKGRHQAQVKPGEVSVEAQVQPGASSLTLTHSSSVDKSTGADAPFNPVKLMFDAGVSLLGQAGYDDKQSRSMIGKWRAKVGDDEVRLAIAECQIANISDPLPYLEKRFANAKPAEPKTLHAIINERMALDRLGATA